MPLAMSRPYSLPYSHILERNRRREAAVSQWKAVRRRNHSKSPPWFTVGEYVLQVCSVEAE